MHTMDLDLRNTRQASCRYKDMEQAGDPAKPLEFPKPLVNPAYMLEESESIAMGDRILTGKTVLVVRRRNESEETGFALKRRLHKTKWGSVVQCEVVTRLKGSVDQSWRSSSQLVAIKAWSKATIGANKRSVVKDPLHEAAVLQHVGSYHSNVIGCQQVLEDRDYFYTVLPHYPETALHALAGGKMRGQSTLARLDEQQARRWFTQLIHGIFHLQKKGVYHGNLSLDNILVDENGDLKIIDLASALRVPYSSRFGYVSDLSEGSQRLLLLPQPHTPKTLYTAPEVLNKKAFDGFSADLWSCGVILFVLLVGRAPYGAAHKSDPRFVQITRGNLRSLLETLNVPVTEDACDLLQNLLREDPRHRLTLSGVLDHPWYQNPPDRVSPLITAAPRRVITPESKQHLRHSSDTSSEREAREQAPSKKTKEAAREGAKTAVPKSKASRDAPVATKPAPRDAPVATKTAPRDPDSRTARGPTKMPAPSGAGRTKASKKTPTEAPREGKGRLVLRGGKKKQPSSF